MMTQDASSRIMEERIKLAVGQGLARRSSEVRRDRKQLEDMLSDMNRLTKRLDTLEEHQVK